MGDVIAFPGGWHGPQEPASAQPRCQLLWREAAGHELRQERVPRARRVVGDGTVDVAAPAGSLSEVNQLRGSDDADVLPRERPHRAADDDLVGQPIGHRLGTREDPVADGVLTQPVRVLPGVDGEQLVHLLALRAAVRLTADLL